MTIPPFGWKDSPNATTPLSSADLEAFGAYIAGYPKQAATAATGFALQNATPTILTFTTANDGALHAVTLYHNLVVTSNQTGGAIQITYTLAGTLRTVTVSAGGLTTGITGNTSAFALVCDPNTAVTLSQSSAQTAGAATEYALLILDN